MNKKQIILNDRDLQLFRFVDKYRVAAVKSISLACGFNSMQYVSRRIKKLVEYGYINHISMYLGHPHFYCLTKKGLKEIGIDAKPYRPAPTTAFHYVGVADCAAYLAYNYGLDAVKDFFVDKDFYHNDEVIERYSLKSTHKPDIIFVKGPTTYYVEFERSRKGKKKILENILMNHLSGVNQIWIVSDIPFEDIKKECASTPHYQETVTFIDYSEISHNLKVLGGVKVEQQ